MPNDPQAGGDATALDLEQPLTVETITAAPPVVWYRRRDRMLKIGAGLLVAVICALGGVIALKASQAETAIQGKDFGVSDVQLGQDTIAPVSSQPVLNVNGQLQVSNSLVLAPTTLPDKPLTGQLYYDKSNNQLSYYNGKQFVAVGATIVQNTVGGNVTNITNVFNSSTTNVTNINNSSGSGSVTTPGGTTGAIPKFTGSQTIGNSIISDDGTKATVNGSINLASPSSAGTTEFKGWPENPTPIIIDGDDTHTVGVEVGVKFKADYNGQVRGVRFYKSNNNVGTHVGSLWTSGGSKLASVTFSAESASGWQEARFSAPVTVAADTTYIVSYHEDPTTVTGISKLHYSVDLGYFATKGIDNGPLHILQDGFDGNNGMYAYSNVSAFPNRSLEASNYWVDVIYAPTTVPAQYQIDGAQLSSINLSNNVDLAKRSSGQVFSGSNIFRSAVDGVAFQIQSSNTTPLLRADTAALQLVVGDSTGSNNPVLFFFSNKNSAGDSPGAEGAMYYNSTLGSFRCYYDAAWYNCADPNPQHTYTLYDEFLGGNLSSLASPVSSLGWNATAIGANGTISANPATPVAQADRPGVLSIQTPATANQGTTLSLSSGGGSMVIAKGQDFKTSVAVGSATSGVLRVGLFGQASGSSRPLSGVWWEADPSVSNFWQFCSGGGTAAICLPSTDPITANSWETLRIKVVATGTSVSEASFYIGDSSYNIDTVTIDTTNLTAPSLTCLTKTAGAQHCYWDYFQLTGVTTARR